MSDRIRNWSKYNASLKRQGNLTFWLDREVIEEHETLGKPRSQSFESHSKRHISPRASVLELKREKELAEAGISLETDAVGECALCVTKVEEDDRPESSVLS